MEAGIAEQSLPRRLLAQLPALLEAIATCRATLALVAIPQASVAGLVLLGSIASGHAAIVALSCSTQYCIDHYGASQSREALVFQQALGTRKQAILNTE